MDLFNKQNRTEHKQKKAITMRPLKSATLAEKGVRNNGNSAQSYLIPENMISYRIAIFYK